MNNSFSISRFNAYLWCETRLNIRRWLLFALAIAACATITYIGAGNIWRDNNFAFSYEEHQMTFPIFLMFASAIPYMVAGVVSLSLISQLFTSFHKEGSGSFAMTLPASTSEKFLVQLKLSILIQLALAAVIEVVYCIFCYNEMGVLYSSLMIEMPEKLTSELNIWTVNCSLIFIQSTAFLAGVIFKKSAFIKLCAIYAATMFLSGFASLILKVSNPFLLSSGIIHTGETSQTVIQITYLLLTAAAYTISWMLFKRIQIKK